ncbi:MAG: hypothetical protein ACOY30_15635 [Bacillota bacterium]
MPDISIILNKMSDPIFAFTLLEFVTALVLWIHSLIKKTSRRRFWFIITVITFLIFMAAVDSPYLGK